MRPMAKKNGKAAVVSLHAWRLAESTGSILSPLIVYWQGNPALGDAVVKKKRDDRKESKERCCGSERCLGM